MLELAVVISILMLLAALISPTLTKAKQSAKEKVGLLQLRQAHQAAMIYMIDYPMPRSYDRPRLQDFYDDFFGLERRALISPCGLQQAGDGTTAHIISYVYFHFEHDFYNELETYQDNSLLFADLHCNPYYEVRFQDYQEKRALGITISGQLLNKYQAGNPYRQRFWVNPPTD